MDKELFELYFKFLKIGFIIAIIAAMLVGAFITYGLISIMS